MQSQSKTYWCQVGISNNYASMMHIISDTIPILSQLGFKLNQVWQGQDIVKEKQGSFTSGLLGHKMAEEHTVNTY